MKNLNKLLILAGAMLAVACGPKKTEAPVAVHWSIDEQGDTRTEHFVVTNNSGKEIAQGWEIWFDQGGRRDVTHDEVGVAFKEIFGGSLYKMTPTENFVPIPAGEVRDIALPTQRRFNSNHNAPEGMFIVLDGVAYPVEFSFDRAVESERKPVLVDASSLKQTDILPYPKNVAPIEGTTTIEKSVGIAFPDIFAGEAKLLIEKLKGFGIEAQVNQGATPVTFVHDATISNPEGYKLEIADGRVNIIAGKGAGAFYGAQTLVDMLKGKSVPVALENMTIEDHPDFGYRGQHFDISRNYTSKENVMRVIDLLASYKLNVFHFHFTDDEGWRIEIEGLPELTEIGARRGYTPDERDMLLPAYGSGGDPEQGTGSGFLTRADFIEILKFAQARHMIVIPEIESPGHARAARVAMNERYRKYIDTDPEKAREFLLNDFDDTSVYNSAQNYHDNVMNVALPSVYRFMEKVIDEVASMYAEAGIPLWTIHVGGDEVPHGSWTGSPIAAKFMEENGIKDVVALGEYYILKVNDLLKERGIKMSGWQELVEGRSAEFRAAVKDNLAFVNCWSTNGRQARVPYELANLGYPVVLSNVGNLYFDLAYNNNPAERGLSWGGYVDDKASFSLQPFNIYASLRRDRNGNPIDIATAGDGLEKLTAEGAKNILGLQGQLWAETIRNFDMVTYMFFPKMFGLVERGWNSTPEWSKAANENAAFEADYAKFRTVEFGRELPWLKGQGLVVRDFEY